ncbi:BamA/TamA family outer membrane protein [bacterium]|nr:BamA/TamA family outer membrane protein [bacterium]
MPRGFLKPLLSFVLLVAVAFPAAGSAADEPAPWLRREALHLTGGSALEESVLRAALPDSFRAAGARALLDSVQRSLHADRGYYAARLLSLETSTDGLRLRLESGPRARIGRVSLDSTVSPERETLRPALESCRGLAAGRTGVELALERLARAVAERGYPFCRVELAAVSLDSTARWLELTVRLETGRRCRLGEVSFPGLSLTRPATALRLSGLEPGADYRESGLRSARGRLLRSGLFREAGQVRVAPGRDSWRADVSLPLKEAPASRLEAALGSGGASGASTVSGYFHLELANLFGTARRARVSWEHPRRDWSSLEVSYREPWLLGTGLALEAMLSQSLRDSLYSSTGASLRLTVPAGACGRLGLGARYEKTSPGSETWELSRSGSLWSVEGLYERSDLDNPYNPRLGSRVTATGSAGRRSVEAVDRREIRAAVELRAYHPVTRGLPVAALAAGYSFVSRGSSSVAELPYQARIPVGGVSREGGPVVRGHPEEELRARRAFWFSLEQRWPIGELGRVFLFYDLCTVQAPDTPERAPEGMERARWETATLQGYGAGMQLESRLGLLGLALGLQPGRGPGQARLHLSLSELF